MQNEKDLDTNSNINTKKQNTPTKKAFDELDSATYAEKKQEFRSFFFAGFNDYDIYVRVWDKVSEPKAVVLIAHGMVEHGLRYDEFAQFLNKAGYIVVVPDCRGHGRTAGAPDQVGVYEGDMFGDIVRDNIKLADMLINYYKLPLVVMGHSYGSFITQSFIQNYHKHQAVILIGSSCFKGKLDARVGKIVADTTAFFCGKKAKAKMIYDMTFGQYGKGKEDGNWLTHDKNIFQEYMQDPYCGAVCTAQFYRSFFANLIKLYRSSGLNMIDKETPILITSGAEDPLAGKNHKMLDNLNDLYKSKGLNVTYKVWQNGYHELLNEVFRKDVYKFIQEWLDNIF